MNNPKFLTMASCRAKRTEECNLINFIDRLPHIMKEDKMILRKRAKGGDPVLYEILNKRNIHNFRDDEDFKRLEATVRKYLNDLKSAEREEQIRRYKNTLKSYRSSCEKPGNKENAGLEKKVHLVESCKFDRINPKSARSPMSSSQKLHDLKNLKLNKPVYQPQRLDTLKAKYSIQKDKHRNLHTTIELNPKGKMRSSKRMSESASAHNLIKTQVAFDSSINLKTEVPQSLTKCHTDRQPIQYPKNDPVSFAQFQDLFTPPDLLRECQIILEKAKQEKEFHPSDPISPKFHSNNEQSPEYLCQKPKSSLQQQYSGPQTVSFCKEQSDSGLLENYTFKKPTEEKVMEKAEKANFQTKTAEYIFDCIFTDSYQITFETFSQVINKLFSSPLELYRLFQRADTSHSGSVTIYQLGKCLQQTCGSQENYIRDIFQLLDMDRKGHITESDISNFVRQIVDTSYENEGVVKEMFMRVLYEADFKNNGRVEYWALYYVKGLECFKEMVVYISQFEFEVQC